MRTLIILLLCTNTSFAIAQISPKAVEKNNQSVKTAGFFNDSDSLNKAIHLSDEAIALEPSYKLAYANKIKYLMALGQKEKALQTMLQMEKFSPDDPYYILGKGMMLEENAKKSLAMDAYKQAASLFEKRLKEKPTEADPMNYVFVLFLRDNKNYSLDEIEKEYPQIFSPAIRQHTKKLIDELSNKREDVIHEMLGGK